MLIDIKLLRDSIEKIGWVETAEIRRKLPDSLEIKGWCTEYAQIAKYVHLGFQGAAEWHLCRSDRT
jgi:cell division septal protein FtsQ